MIKRSIKEYLLLFISSFGILVVTAFMIARIYQQAWNNAILDAVITLALLSLFYYVYKTRNTKKASMFLGIIAMLAVVVLIWLKGISQIYWEYPLIIAAYYLFTIRIALIYSALLMVVVGVLTFEQTTLVDFSTIITTLIMANIFAYFSARNIRQQNISLVNNERLAQLRNKTLELIVSSQKLTVILEYIVKSVQHENSNVTCSISLIDESGRFLVIGAAPNLPQELLEQVNRVKIGPESTSCSVAAFYGKKIVVADIKTDTRCYLLKDVVEKSTLGACWSEPIVNSDGITMGVFGIYHSPQYQPTEEVFILVEQFAHLASISIEREKNSLLIWQQANFDSLTGLPNRNMMRSHLTQLITRAQRDNEKIAIAFLDLDHFKDVNDTLGHHIGDALLIETANRIKQSIRNNDIVARLGGDEFVIIMSNLKDFKGVEVVAEQLRKAISLPYYLHNEVVHSGVSIGITIYPDDATEIDDLLQNADQAMYGAKNLGRNNFHYFTPSMRNKAIARMQLIHDLRKAINNDEFFVVYQPIINLQTNEIYKAEALIRWQHPTQGIISPDYFIPIAEETGLIIEISDFVFKTALKDVKEWRKTMHANFQVSINTSPVQYNTNSGNIKAWMDLLSTENELSKMIAFEITENLLMENKKDVGNILTLIKKAGIPISIDDFGTGYSSLSYLKNYETDYLKIDKSFVQKISENTKELALCEAMIVMAKKLNIKVIAEGIELEEHRIILRDICSDYGQGYLFSKPVKKQEFESYIVLYSTEKNT